MYCENCGHKLNDTDLFCEDCGFKVNNVVSNIPNNSNKKLWIILGCVFGGLVLFIILIIMFFAILIIDYNSVDGNYDYEIKDYIDNYEEVSSFESFNY